MSDGKTTPEAERRSTPSGQEIAGSKADRLAKALRANLGRRKAQMRARKASGAVESQDLDDRT